MQTSSEAILLYRALFDEYKKVHAEVEPYADFWIIVDSREREQDVLWQCLNGLPHVIRAKLDCGDILLMMNGKGVLLFERKTDADLMASVFSSRMHSQKSRLLSTPELIATQQVVYLLIGSGPARTPVQFASLPSLVKFARDRTQLQPSTGSSGGFSRYRKKGGNNDLMPAYERVVMDDAPDVDKDEDEDGNDSNKQKEQQQQQPLSSSSSSSSSMQTLFPQLTGGIASYLSPQLSAPSKERIQRMNGWYGTIANNLGLDLVNTMQVPCEMEALVVILKTAMSIMCHWEVSMKLTRTTPLCNPVVRLQKSIAKHQPKGKEEEEEEKIPLQEQKEDLRSRQSEEEEEEEDEIGSWGMSWKEAARCMQRWKQYEASYDQQLTEHLQTVKQKLQEESGYLTNDERNLFASMLKQRSIADLEKEPSFGYASLVCGLRGGTPDRWSALQAKFPTLVDLLLFVQDKSKTYTEKCNVLKSIKSVNTHRKSKNGVVEVGGGSARSFGEFGVRLLDSLLHPDKLFDVPKDFSIYDPSNEPPVPAKRKRVVKKKKEEKEEEEEEEEEESKKKKKPVAKKSTASAAPRKRKSETTRKKSKKKKDGFQLETEEEDLLRKSEEEEESAEEEKPKKKKKPVAKKSTASAARKRKTIDSEPSESSPLKQARNK